MASHSILKSFYASEAWLRLRAAILAERGAKCQKCGRVTSELQMHHIIELTPENVADAMVSLDPANILVLCHDCHDAAHCRFGRQPERGVWVVYGPPLSGKSTFVRQNMRRGDLVIDMDRLYAAVSMLPDYDKPDALLPNVLGVHNLLLDNVRTRYGKWGGAWVVGGFADRYKREKVADDLGAELVFCQASREQCLGRLAMDEGRRCRQDEWRRYIDEWFERYQA